MLAPLSMYARCLTGSALALLASLAAFGCDGPNVSSPGLEPPSGRDAGPDDKGGAGASDPEPGTKPPGHIDAGERPPPTGGPSGGMSGSDGPTAPGMMMPTMNPPPMDDDAGTEP